MDEEIQKAIEPPKGMWQRIGTVVSSPLTSVTKMTKESPAMVLIAILLVVQPIVQTGIELVKGLIEFKQDLDPNNRPVTKAELDVINSKIDFLEELVLTDTKEDRERLNRQDTWMDKKKPKPVVVIPQPDVTPDTVYNSLKQKLDDVTKKADANFKANPPKK